MHDAENRLVAATTSAMSVIYRYDAAGRRVMKDFVSGAYADTAFLHAGDMEIAEYDASGTLLRRFIPGLGTDDRVAMIEVGAGCGASASSCSETSRAYYVADRIGHVIATFDASGDLIDSYRYTPFGVHDDGTPQAGQPFRYTGRRLDPETGLYFYRARYYDQQHGRFLETDPVGYADQMNLYGYVGNDPLNGTDPTGKCGPASLVCAGAAAGCAATGPACPAGGAVGAVVGGIATGVVAIGAMIILNNDDSDQSSDSGAPPDLTDEEGAEHILDGDERGGGHRPGTDNPGKSEFPAGWSDDRILGEVSDVATDPDAERHTEGDRNVSEGTRDGVDIRTVDDGARIITGYPTNTGRNPPRPPDE